MQWTSKDQEQVGDLKTDTVYPFEVIEAEEKISQKGNKFINMKLKVFVDGKERTLYDNLMPQLFNKLKSFCLAFHLEQQLASMNLKATECLHHQGFIRTSKKKHDDRVQVDTYLATRPSVAAPAATQSPQPVTEGADPDAPF